MSKRAAEGEAGSSRNRKHFRKDRGGRGGHGRKEDQTSTQVSTKDGADLGTSKAGLPNNGPGWFSTHNDQSTGSNSRFEAYYKGHVVAAEEWSEVVGAFTRQLPISFRLSTIGGRATRLLDVLQGHCFGLPKEPKTVTMEGETITFQAPTPLPWYTPLGHAYQINLGKRELKRIPELRAFRQFLMREDKQGNITRQEAVSMIPPQLLDVQPHHFVLDMCAAPGSKTAQLLEALHAEGPSVVPSGVVVANDADSKRAYMLVHQLKRLGSPAFLVTTHDGQFFPNLFLNADSEAGRLHAAASDSQSFISTALDTVTGERKEQRVVPMGFDRILCDVPCSGDGTLRKSPNIWRSWSLANGFGLHPLQLSIAWRAAQLLKVGGKMVYSTCSLNPIEDEAVVAELLRKARGALRLVDVSDKLPGLKREAGLHSWDVVFEDNRDVDKASFRNERRRQQQQPQQKEGDAAAATSEEENKQTSAISDASDAAGNSEATEPSAVEVEEADPEDGVWYGRPKARCFVTETSTGPVRLLRMSRLADVEALPLTRQRRVRNSYFSPQVLEEFRQTARTQHAATASYEAGTSSTGSRVPYKFDSTSASLALKAPTTQLSAKDMHLERCLRILPHRQDTGGFFIVLIEKVAPLPEWNVSGDAEDGDVKAFSGLDASGTAAATDAATPLPAESTSASSTTTATTVAIEADTAASSSADATNATKESSTTTPTTSTTSSIATTTTTSDSNNNRRPQLMKPRVKQFNDFPFIPLSNSHCESIERTFRLNEAQGYKRSNLYARSDNLSGAGKKVYFLSDSIASIVSTEKNYRLKVVHSGLKVFEATSGSQRRIGIPTAVAEKEKDGEEEIPAFRVAQEALNFAVPYLRRQLLRVTTSDMLALLVNKTLGKRHFELSLQLQAQVAARAPVSLSVEKVKAAAAQTNVDISSWLALGVDESSSSTASSSMDDIESKSSNIPQSMRGKLDLGSVVLEVPVEDLPLGSTTRLLCAAWLTHNNLALMIDDAEKQSLTDLLDPASVTNVGDGEADDTKDTNDE